MKGLALLLPLTLKKQVTKLLILTVLAGTGFIWLLSSLRTGESLLILEL
jgi:hypothetical protein